jgi:hypothetical protein
MRVKTGDNWTHVLDKQYKVERLVRYRTCAQHLKTTNIQTDTLLLLQQI